MTKKYAGKNLLASHIAEIEGVSKKEGERLLRVFLTVLEEALADPDKDGVQFLDFITIEKLMRKKKLGRNPRNPDEEVMIPARIGFKVNVGKEFAKKLGY